MCTIVGVVIHLLMSRLCCSSQASKWVDDGIYLLASQPVDKCLSHEGAELALQELEGYLNDAEQNQLSDPSTIWTEFEAVLNQQLRVRRANKTHLFHLFQTGVWVLMPFLVICVHQGQVEKVFQKQLSMQDMFDKRRVSLKKLATKQTRPVQPVAPRPEAFIKSPLSSPG